MVNPEFDDAAVTEVHFELQGVYLPRDHGYPLFLELSRLLPWLADETLAAVHPIHGAETGKDDLLILNRRAKLVMRIPTHREADLAILSGQTITVGGFKLTIGKGKAKPLARYSPLYAHCVTTGSMDEEGFASDIIRLLDELKITCRFICGRRQTITTADGVAYGYSLLLHELPVEHSILVQQRGMGCNRKIGCGIFIPHKSTNALV
ncbi:MAG: type I-MYXAN CRISPR-associated protein Cas6/Cmx6 [Betaproteobacteria bacterium CG2_30_59_46]|nr:MAG: type I-MYXAN CRISPR-associated protein Cas6/Cmx6 [Betaproteobacteria bacterium CG2_30_59_46]